ncbi:hypothetical protein L9F63_018506 [Diploptera punctata]|uniref:ATP-dependent (S)-NAD(P)H-hydrate dehydratase n=1 Tax=Diploptera punctata TaxID=6984 RepID=A0AAD8EF24_DIPPU|nr:hypothetical protein L9F63_018506 [Diploptera punctata]
MSCISDSNASEEAKLLDKFKNVIPQMGGDRYKGQAGRVGVIGGSIEYTGAPYFAAITALKVGCDLAHVFCAKEAAPVIKSYSPELIVHPLLDSENALDLIVPWIPRLHSLVIGPGLGRDPKILETVTSIINYCGNQNDIKPIVIDADGLFLVTQNPKVIQGYPHGLVLTPNAIEFSRLAKTVLNVSWEPTPNPDPERVQKLAAALGHKVVILHKGATDVISGSENSLKSVVCTIGGSGRRCGGQGDLLSGSLGTFICWEVMRNINCPTKDESLQTGVLASYAACRLTRLCNEKAVKKNGRSTLTTDMLNEIHSSFTELFGE